MVCVTTEGCEPIYSSYRSVTDGSLPLTWLQLHAKGASRWLTCGARRGLALSPLGTAFLWDGCDLLWRSVLRVIVPTMFSWAGRPAYRGISASVAPSRSLTAGCCSWVCSGLDTSDLLVMDPDSSFVLRDSSLSVPACGF